MPDFSFRMKKRIQMQVVAEHIYSRSDRINRYMGLWPFGVIAV